MLEVWKMGEILTFAGLQSFLKLCNLKVPIIFNQHQNQLILESIPTLYLLSLFCLDSCMNDNKQIKWFYLSSNSIVIRLAWSNLVASIPSISTRMWHSFSSINLDKSSTVSWNWETSSGQKFPPSEKSLKLSKQRNNFSISND